MTSRADLNYQQFNRQWDKAVENIDRDRASQARFMGAVIRKIAYAKMSAFDREQGSETFAPSR